MARKLELEVGNFICRFSPKLVLNDLLSEVVLPAYHADRKRAIMGTEYFFIDREFRYLVKDEIESLALCCRIVKRTKIKRHQIYSETRGIVPDEKDLDSAPTSIAILLLYSHRLLFVREVPNAPTMHQYGSTFRYLMRDEILDYREGIFNKPKNKLSRKEIAQEVQIPEIRVVPVPSTESLKTFIDRFELLTTLKVQVAPTNNELDNEDFFKDTRIIKKQVGSSKTTLTHYHPNGLDKDGCREHVDAAKQGSLFVELKGKDENGDELKGDNDSFSVKAPLATTATSMRKLSEKAFSKYKELKDEAVISEGEQNEDYAEKLREVFNLG